MTSPEAFTSLMIRAAEDLGKDDEAAALKSASFLHRVLCSPQVELVIVSLVARSQLLGALLAAILYGVRSIERSRGDRQTSLLAVQAIKALLDALRARCGQLATADTLAFFLPGLLSGMGALASREARSAALRMAAVEIVGDLVECVFMEGPGPEDRDDRSARDNKLAASSAEVVAQMRKLFLKSAPADKQGVDSGSDDTLSSENRAPPAECASESASGSHLSAIISHQSKHRIGDSEERFRVERTEQWREETATRIISLTAYILASMSAAESPSVREAAAGHCGRIAVNILGSPPTARTDNGGSTTNPPDGSGDEVGILGALLLLAGDHNQGVAAKARSALATLGNIENIWSTYLRDGTVSLFWSWLESIDQKAYGQFYRKAGDSTVSEVMDVVSVNTRRIAGMIAIPSMCEDFQARMRRISTLAETCNRLIKVATYGKNATVLVNEILDGIQSALDGQTLSRFIEHFRNVASAATSSLATRSEETVAASAIALASSTLRLVSEEAESKKVLLGHAIKIVDTVSDLLLAETSDDRGENKEKVKAVVEIDVDGDSADTQALAQCALCSLSDVAEALGASFFKDMRLWHPALTVLLLGRGRLEVYGATDALGMAATAALVAIAKIDAGLQYKKQAESAGDEAAETDLLHSFITARASFVVQVLSSLLRRTTAALSYQARDMTDTSPSIRIFSGGEHRVDMAFYGALKLASRSCTRSPEGRNEGAERLLPFLWEPLAACAAGVTAAMRPGIINPSLESVADLWSGNTTSPLAAAKCLIVARIFVQVAQISEATARKISAIPTSKEKYAVLNDIGPAAKGCACICVEASAPLCNAGRSEQAIAAMEAVRAGLSAMAIIDATRKAFRKDPSVSGDEYRGVMEWEAEESKQEGGLPKVLQVLARAWEFTLLAIKRPVNRATGLKAISLLAPMCVAGEDGFLARRIAKQAWPLLEQLVRAGKFSAGAISGGDLTDKPSLSPGKGLLPDLPARQLLQINTLGTASDRDLSVPASQSEIRARVLETIGQISANAETRSSLSGIPVQDLIEVALRCLTDESYWDKHTGDSVRRAAFKCLIGLAAIHSEAVWLAVFNRAINTESIQMTVTATCPISVDITAQGLGDTLNLPGTVESCASESEESGARKLEIQLSPLSAKNRQCGKDQGLADPWSVAQLLQSLDSRVEMHGG